MFSIMKTSDCATQELFEWTVQSSACVESKNFTTPQGEFGPCRPLSGRILNESIFQRNMIVTTEFMMANLNSHFSTVREIRTIRRMR